MYRSIQLSLKLALIVFMVNGCSGKRPDEMGIDPSGLRGCPKARIVYRQKPKTKSMQLRGFV